MPESCDIYWGRLSELRPRHLALLSDVEAGRRDAYLHAEDRSRFTLGAVLLRLVVGTRLGLAAAAVRIDRTCAGCGQPHGRPRLTDGELHLSVAHSGDFAGVAVTAAGPVGIDVEVVQSLDHWALLDDVLAHEERKQEPTLQEFFRYWARKEAVLKATGAGLTVPMRTVVVTRPARPARLLRYPGDPAPAAQMIDSAPAPGYEGAATVLGAEPIAFRTRDGDGLLRGCR
jgi:4'-phosphopantetheinyl transferase